MWLGLLIATITIVGFLTISLWLKLYFEEVSSNSEINCEVDSGNVENISACDHCGIKDLTNCSVINNISKI